MNTCEQLDGTREVLPRRRQTGNVQLARDARIGEGDVVAGPSERSASSLARPPAFRMTCASPSRSPASFAGSMRASMHVKIAKRRAGGSASFPRSPKSDAQAALAARTSCRTLLISASSPMPNMVVLIEQLG
jgi:hypothetical protein